MGVHDASMHESAGARTRTRPIRVALVDDHQFIADMLRRALERQPERFEYVGNAPRLADVGALLRRDPADVVLVDYSLPDGRGSDVLRIVRRHWPRARMVLFTGHATLHTALEAFRRGATDYMLKPVDVAYLCGLLSRVPRARGSRDANDVSDAELNSPEHASARSTADVAVSTSAPTHGSFSVAVGSTLADVEGFELFTGSRSEANIRLYERLGYRRSHEQVLSPGVTLVYLEKRR